MSSIALVVRDLGQRAAKSTLVLSKVSSLSLKSVMDAVKAGIPVFVRPVFDRKDELFAEKLLRVLEQLDTLGCKWVAWELLDGQAFSPREQYFEITVNRLRNMIAADQESLEEQRREGELEDGENLH